MKKRPIIPLLTLLLLPLLHNCASTKDIIYFQDINQVQLQPIQAEYITRIAKDDILSIVVVGGLNKEAAMPYNLTLSETTNTSQGKESVIPYLVDSQGNIDFPAVGTIHVEGMTRMELTQYLTERISEYVEKPVVVVSFMDYKITVLGDVASPGTYTMPSERTTLLQALGIAGDLNITADRRNVLLIREIDGKQTHANIDLTSSRVMDSPYFYLHQNDVLYVQPSRARIAQGTQTANLWSTGISFVMTAISLGSMIYTLTLQNAKAE